MTYCIYVRKSDIRLSIERTIKTKRDMHRLM